MAASLHFFAVKTPYSGFRRSSLTVESSQFGFSVSVVSDSGFGFGRGGAACGLKISKMNCKRGVVSLLEEDETVKESDNGNARELTCVMKFGGSSVASAARMREVAELILSFPEERPVIVLSAMGKTTNNLLQAGGKAISCGVSRVSSIDELSFIKELHLKTADELRVDRSTISAHLEELEQLLKGIAMMKELTLRTRYYLVSFGECMSTRLFTAYLNSIGAKACQVWKDVDGVLTCYPNIYPNAEPVPYLSFEEAAELAYFGAQEN